MLALRGSPRQFCDGVPRRDFLQIGTLGALGLSAPTLLRAAHVERRSVSRTFDAAFATLLDDLAQRGLLADTLVVCMGEFGRTPRINVHAGRDHWGPANSILLAGAGISEGCVYGATDRHGAYPAQNAVSPSDVTASILHLLGVPEGLEIHDRTGRRLRACTGSPIAGVLA